MKVKIIILGETKKRVIKLYIIIGRNQKHVLLLHLIYDLFHTCIEKEAKDGLTNFDRKIRLTDFNFHYTYKFRLF